METTTEKNHAEENARAWMETIVEQVAALEMDWDRYAELKDMDPADMTDDEKEELAELTETAGEYESADDVRERIEEEPLEIKVRSDWYNPGSEPDKPSEFFILLSTGGPALRIRGELDEHGQPDRAWLEYQDWGTPWTEFFEGERSTVVTWASVFYFGE